MTATNRPSLNTQIVKGVLRLLLPLLTIAYGTQAAEVLEPGFNPPTAPRIAIIIDDIGYHYEHGKRSINLPGAVTLAVIPFTPNATRLANLAHKQGKELMLHAPMSNINGTPMEPGALTEDMNRETFISRLRESIDSVPHIQGLNNHMGSLLTQQAPAMSWLMGELKAQQLYFVDSRTSANSVAWQSARNQALPTLKRDIFLDHERNEIFIEQQFQRLLRIATSQGQAVGIGHPYPETLAYLTKAIPELKLLNIELVSISALMTNSNPEPPRQPAPIPLYLAPQDYENPRPLFPYMQLGTAARTHLLAE